MPTKAQPLPSEQKWIEPLEAVHLLSRSLGGDRKAKKAITERLRDGAIKATAWWLATGVDVGDRPYLEPPIVAEVEAGQEAPFWSASQIAEIRRVKTRPEVCHTQVGDGLALEIMVATTDDNLVIGDLFWAAARKEDLDRWNWAAGFFLVSNLAGHWASEKLRKRSNRPFPMRRFALGVQFRRGDIEKILAEPTAPVAISQPAPSPRGAKQSELWPHWVAELAVLIHEEGISFRSANGLIEKIGERLTEQGIPHPSDKTVYDAASAVIRKFGKLKLKS